ncbi:MAG: hypothetical protein ACYC23_24915, partial [Limisphaerales bacterium]
MQLYYNGTALHTAAEVMHQGARYEPDPTTGQRVRVVWRLALHFWDTSFAANRTAREAARTALKTQRATLRWADSSGVTLMEREVEVGPHEWPDEGVGGKRHQILNLDFWWWETDTTPASGSATWTPFGGSAISLGRVGPFKEGIDTQRISPLRSDRTSSAGRVTMAGKILGDTAASPSARRTALLATKETLEAAMAAKEGRLIYGTFDRSGVRVERFEADLDAAGDALEWNLEGTFSRFPNEASYLLVDYTIAERDQRQAGTRSVSMAGRIQSHTAAAARAKLDGLRAALALRYAGFTLNIEGDPSITERIFDGPDGETYLELSFEETYKVSLNTGYSDWRLQMADDDDPASGRIKRTYTGTVGAKAATWQAAYSAAVAKARTLGADRNQIMVSGRITPTDAQQSDGFAGSGNERFCRVEFEFAYQLRGAGRTYLEIASEAQVETFGPSWESVSGFITAATLTDARGIYTQIKAGYPGRIIDGERVTERRVKVAVNGAAPTGSMPTPPLMTGGATVNAAEVLDNAADASGVPTAPPLLGSGYVRQTERLEFSFRVFRQRAAGTVAVKYSSNTETDYLTLEVNTSIGGTVQAATRAEAESAVALLRPGGVTVLSRSYTTDRMKYLGAVVGSGDDAPTPDAESGEPGTLTEFTFRERWVSRVTGDNALLECSVSEDFQHSGPNFVTHATAFGRPVVQQCGYTPATLAVTASALSASEAAATAWVKDQWAWRVSDSLVG